MRFDLTLEQEAFKAEVEDFLRENLPKVVADKVRFGASVSKQELSDWTKVLNARGWAAPHWPLEHGGTAVSYTHLTLPTNREV